MAHSGQRTPSRRAQERRATWLIAVTLSLAACTSEDDDKNPPDTDAPTPGLLGGATCPSCLETECTLQLNACESDPQCRTLRACRAACATAACDSACLADVPDGSSVVAIFESLSHCGAFRCGGDCTRAPVSSSLVQECTDRYTEAFRALLPACSGSRDCACEECATDLTTCFDEPDCPTILACPMITGCIWPFDCWTPCVLNGVGFDLAYRAQECVRQRCEPCTEPFVSCALTSPRSIDDVEGGVHTVYGRAYVAGITDVTSANDLTPNLVARVGYGPDGSSPATSDSWVWTNAEPNASYGTSSPSPQPDRDEYRGDLVLPAASGSPYDYAFAFSIDAGVTWTYCDTNDLNNTSGYDPEFAGDLQSRPAPLGDGAP